VYNIRKVLHVDHDSVLNELGNFFSAIVAFVKGLWHEVGPFVRHGLAVGCLILIAAGVIWLLKFFFSDEVSKDLQDIDHFLVKSLFWVFGGCTLLVIINRLAHYLIMDIRQTWSKPQAGRGEALPEEQARGALEEEAESGRANLDQLLTEIREMRRELDKLRRK
jgi:hypothetical protein